MRGKADGQGLSHVGGCRTVHSRRSQHVEMVYGGNPVTARVLWSLLCQEAVPQGVWEKEIPLTLERRVTMLAQMQKDIRQARLR